MIKTVLKVNGMMCGMCEAHMNDLVRKNFNVKKVTSSVKGGETVVISEENLDIPFLKKDNFLLPCPEIRLTLSDIRIPVTVISIRISFHVSQSDFKLV